jgi:hypothetical protein
LSKERQIVLEPGLVTLLTEAYASLGKLHLLKRAWTPWVEFAYWPLTARWAALETRKFGFNVDLPTLLSLGPMPHPSRPSRGLRLACGLVLAKRKLEAGKPDAVIPPSLASDIFATIDAPHLSRGGTPPAIDLDLPGSGVWSLAPRLLQTGLPPLMVAGITLASWHHQGPEHAYRDISGWVLLFGLSARLGIIPQAVEGSGDWMEQCALETAGGLPAVLNRLRNSGAWREWLGFFLRAIKANADFLTEMAFSTQSLLADHQELVGAWVRAPRRPNKLLELLMRRPVVEVPDIAAELEVTQRTAGQLVSKLKELAILEEITGQRRGRRFAYRPLLDILLPPDADKNPPGVEEEDEYLEN